VNYLYAAKRRRVPGTYIRKWRSDLGLSYATVAQVLGVHEITVRHWEKAALLKPLIKLAFDKAFREKPKHKVVAPRFPGEGVR